MVEWTRLSVEWRNGGEVAELNLSSTDAGPLRLAVGRLNYN